MRTTRLHAIQEVNVGDVIAYVGPRRQGYAGTWPRPDERDWLRVSRVDDAGVHGFRIHPKPWEEEVEFVVVPRQIADNGVIRRGA